MRRAGKVAVVLATLTAALTLIFGGENRQREEGPVGSLMPTPAVHETAATQRIRYFVGKTHRPWGQGFKLRGYMHKAHDLLANHQGKGFRIWTLGQGPEGTQRYSLDDVLAHLRRRSKRMSMRAVILVRAMRDGFTIRGRKFDTNPLKIASTQGTNAIDIVIGTMVSRHPTVRIMGIFQCRTTVYGGWSQHAWSNAVDFGGPLAVLSAVARDAYNLTKAGWLPASQIIWRGHELFSGHYVYDHFEHVHISGRPLMGGTPPCA